LYCIVLYWFSHMRQDSLKSEEREMRKVFYIYGIHFHNDRMGVREHPVVILTTDNGA